MMRVNRLLIALLCSAPWVGYSMVSQTPLGNQERFIAAEQAFKKGQWDAFQEHKSHLKRYPLYPYLEFDALLKQVQDSSKDHNEVSLETLSRFNQQYPHFPRLNTLVFSWLKKQARFQRWSYLLEGYALLHPALASSASECLADYARYQIQINPKVLKDSLAKWHTGSSSPVECDAVFDIMQKHGMIDEDTLYERLFLSLKADNKPLTKQLIGQLPKAQQKTVQSWLPLLEHPERLDKSHAIETLKQLPHYEKILTVLFYKLTRVDVSKAKSLYKKLDLQLELKASDRAFIMQDIGIRLAVRKDSDAVHWLKHSAHNTVDIAAQEWLIRIYLLEKNWQAALETLEKLPLEASQKDVWLYWHARALLQLHHKDQAQDILLRLAQNRSYYGFLASDLLGKVPSLSHQAVPKDPVAFDRIRYADFILRMHEFIAINKAHLARAEWHTFLKVANEAEKLQAARYADLQGWDDLVIHTLAKCQQNNDLKLRFPLAHQRSIVQHARKNALDPAWIFALTRQESAFAEQVRSPVGATGLMQLMPQTAQMVARKNKLPIPSIYDLMQAEKNIQLGSSYLKSLYLNFDEQTVLATASYNAGLNRIKRWLPIDPIDADIWIENIPYYETREYVKNVLTYIGIYKFLLNEPFRISAYMRPVSSQDTGA